VVALVRIAIELFGSEEDIKNYCDGKLCTYRINPFDVTYFSLLAGFELGMTFVWIFNYKKTKLEDYESRNRIGPNVNDAKIVVISSSAVSASADKICAICLESVTTKDDNASLGCHHKFHFTCIQYWLKKKSTCPVCRAKPEELFIARRAMRNVELNTNNIPVN